MKRVFCLIMVFAAVFAVSCSKKKSHDYEERVSKEIKAEEGGTVESSDGKTSVEVPAGALEGDTTITMTVYDAEGYSDENGKIVSKVVEFEPSGTIFKKPVIITIAADEKIEKKTISAAVYNESEKKWSYSQGFYLILDKEDGGDPIMQTTDGKDVVLDNGNLTTAGGDPIMMTNAGGDPIMTNAAGDPIMMSAAGDPIMLVSKDAAGDPIMTNAAGDPIMTSAAGDPIMKAAAGDPIMMTTGHFTTFTLIAFDPRKGEAAEPADDGDTDTTEPDDDEPIDDGDTETAEPDGDTESDDDEIPDETEDEDIIIPEPELVYSKVLCTNSAICINDEEKQQILCPKEGEDFYGQDAQYAARKGCVAHHSYTDIPNPDDAENTFIKDNATGLTWWFTGSYGTFAELQNGCSISYGGIDDWRLPTPKEILTLADHGRIYGAASDPYYIYWMQGVEEGSEDEVAAHTSIESYQYFPYIGRVSYFGYIEALLICVSGDEYGKINPENYIENGDGTVFDSSTNLLWQKNFVKKETWKEALAYCENLEYAGFDDWRLPNKNELVTLIDYSKADEEVVSSFPGFKREEFFLWSSTTTATQYDPVWSIEPYGHVLLMGKGDYWEPGSVRCVRSDLTEKTEIPDCDETGTGPCRDANGTIWSSVLYPEIFAGYPYFYYWESDSTIGVSVLPEMCRYLNESGSNKWRMPTIDEIRSIVTTDKLKTGGTCGVTTECSEESCFSEDDCTGDDSSQTLLYDYGIMYSGTLYGDRIWNLWAVNVKEGSLNETDYSISVSELVQRCVLDETLPDYKKTPWLDPETDLLWSDISPDWIWVYSGKYYCKELSQRDHEHWWRLPTVDELRTLVRNDCGEEDGCPVDINGKYSVLGDISTLLSSEYYGDESYFAIDFSRIVRTGGKDSAERIRCVSEGSGPCKNDPCAGVQHSAGCFADSSEIYHCGCVENYFWDGEKCLNPCDANPCADDSHATGCVPESAEEYSCVCEENYSWVSSRFSWVDMNCVIMDTYTDPETHLTWSVLSFDEWSDAVSYCDELEEGGYDDWRLPTIDELRTLIQNCEGAQANGACPISDPDSLAGTLLSSEDCECESEGNKKGFYSKLGDNGMFWSSSLRDEDPDHDTWVVSFETGSVGYAEKDYIRDFRCVRKDSQVLPSN